MRCSTGRTAACRQDPPGNGIKRKRVGILLLVLLVLLGGTAVTAALWGRTPASNPQVLTSPPELVTSTPTPAGVILTPYTYGDGHANPDGYAYPYPDANPNGYAYRHGHVQADDYGNQADDHPSYGTGHHDPPPGSDHAGHDHADDDHTDNDCYAASYHNPAYSPADTDTYTHDGRR